MSLRTFLLCFISCLASACSGSCEPKSPAPKPKPAAERQARQAPDPAPATAPSPEVVPLPAAPDPPGEAAYAHFDAANQAIRAVLAADLESAAPHLAWLSHHEYPLRLPAAWRANAARLQLAARVLARASTPGEAARDLPALSAACGACHAALSKHDLDTQEHPSQHGDAALALLDSLSRRSEGLYTSAAGLTVKIAAETDPAALGALRKAVERAEAADTWVARTSAAQEIFALCGSCHSALGQP